MKMKNEYVAPQITVLDLGMGDIVTDILAVSSDAVDNWGYDLFGPEEAAVLFRK